jgi:hypothetical protein
MLLGLVLHSGASYVLGPITWMWPYRDPRTSLFFNLLLAFIHLFRVFFVMAGFFAELLYHRDGPAGFVRNRVKRVLLPLVVFWPVVIPLASDSCSRRSRSAGRRPGTWSGIFRRCSVRCSDTSGFCTTSCCSTRQPCWLCPRRRGCQRGSGKTPPMRFVLATRWWGVLALASLTTITVLPMTSTNKSRYVTVGTTKKSAAMIWPTWLARTVRHGCEGGLFRRGMNFATVA